MLLKKIWVLVFSFMYLVSVDPMDRSKLLVGSKQVFFLSLPLEKEIIINIRSKNL
jgi:hypothetical protein